MRLLILLLSTSIIFMGCEAFLGDSFKGDEKVVMEPDEEIMYATISGVLTDNVTSDPIANATVTAFYTGGTKTATTDSDGWWHLADLPYRIFDVDANDDDMTGTEYRIVQLKYTHANFQIGTATVNLWGHIESTMGRTQLKWGSNVVHEHTTTAHPELVSVSYDQEDDRATKSYYLPNGTSNITVGFNMPMDTDWSGNSPFELFDANGAIVAYSGSWSSDRQTFTVNPTSDLTCTNRLRYHRLRLIRRIRTWDDDSTIPNSDFYLHFMDSDVHIDFRVLCDDEPTLLTSTTPVLAPSLDSAVTYQFDSMGVDSRNSAGDVSVAAAANTDIWVSWSHVSGAKEYRVYVVNVSGAVNAANCTYGNQADCVDYYDGDRFDTDTNENQLEDQRFNWYDTGLSPIVNEVNSTVRVNITGVYSANYMGDSKLLGGESVKFVVTAIDVDGFESPIASTTPLTITDGKGPSLSTSAGTDGGSTANSETNSATVKRLFTLTFNEEMKTSLGDDNVTLTITGNNISSITETGAWGWTDWTTWSDDDLEMTFAVPSTTLSAAIYGAETLLQVASTSTFLVGDVIGILDNSSTPSRLTGTIQDINTADKIITLAGAITPSTNYAIPSGASVLLVNRGSGLTAYRTTTAANAQEGLTDNLTVASATNFFVGQSVDINNLDDDGTFDCTNDVTTAMEIASISGTTLTFTTRLPRDIPSGSLVLDASVSCGEQAPRSGAELSTSQEEVIFDTSTASTTIRSTGEYADDNSSYILVAATTGFGVNDFVKIAASSASTTLGAVDNSTSTSITVASSADFKEGDTITIHGKVASLTVTDDGSGTTDNNTLRGTHANDWGGANNDNFSFSNGVQIHNGDVIALADAAVTTTLASSLSRENATDNISLTSTAGLAEGQTLTIDDGTEAAKDEVVIRFIYSKTNVEVSGIATDTTQPYLAGAIVTRAKVTENCTVDTGGSSTTQALCGDMSEAFSDAMTATLNRAYEQRVIDNVTSSTVIVLTATTSAVHESGAAVTLRSFPEIREITAVDTYSMTLDSALVYPHHNGAAVTKAATAKAEFSAGEMDAVLVGDVVVVDEDGSNTTVLDRIDATVASINTEDATVVLTPVTATTSIVTIDGDNATFTFMGDAVKVTGAQDSNGNAQQTDYARYGNLNNDTIDR